MFLPAFNGTEFLIWNFNSILFSNIQLQLLALATSSKLIEAGARVYIKKRYKSPIEKKTKVKVLRAHT